uniref:pyrroline-5-carboxylate reductase n=1 Tax=Romanomermis culicivorax TaxID=13658 RepID=A0A915KEI5_ROMCU
MKIGFIGAGKMAQALARGMIASGKFLPENIMASSPKRDQNYLDDIRTVAPITVTHDNVEIAHKCDLIVIAVKPPLVRKVAAEIAPSINKNKLVVSIALGITIRSIETLLPSKARVVRVMPNTPAVVRAGASAYSMGSACLEGDSEIVNELFSTAGFAVEVPESLVDPVTGLSGSGPSYMFCAIEALADGGVKMGIPRDLSVKLAAHTLLTGLCLFRKNRQKRFVPKVSHESWHMHRSKGLLIDAVEAACTRSKQTGEGAQNNDAKF